MAGNSNTLKECDNMDELYIRMCQQAKEIRDTRKPKWANLKPGFEDFEVVNDNEGNRWYIETTSMEGYVLYTWLPRIEDLQEIIKTERNITGEVSILIMFCDYMKRDFKAGFTKGIKSIIVNSMIELWLCFVMETVYHKRWNGTTWEDKRIIKGGVNRGDVK